MTRKLNRKKGWTVKSGSWKFVATRRGLNRFRRRFCIMDLHEHEEVTRENRVYILKAYNIQSRPSKTYRRKLLARQKVLKKRSVLQEKGWLQIALEETT